MKLRSAVVVAVILLGVSSVFLRAKPGGGGSAVMGRMRTIGWETNTVQTADLDGLGIGTSSLDSAVVNSGTRSLKFDSGAGNAAAYALVGLKIAEFPATGTPVFARAYFYFDNLPTAATTKVLVLKGFGGGAIVSARVTSGAKLALYNDVSNAQIGSDSATTLAAATWYRIEVSYTSSSSAGTQAAELQLDGVSVASSSTLTIATSRNLSDLSIGWQTAPGASLVGHADDFALNDGLGASQNSWPGQGKIVLLKPISDNAVGTGWVDGDGAGTLFGSVDNTPPVGAATPADGTQIKNLTSTTTANYDANMTTYSGGGLGPTDTISLVQAVINHAEAIATGTKAGAVLIVSNPAQAVEDTFNYGDDGGAMGAFAANWSTQWGSAQYVPAVNIGTAPVMRVGKRTATTREVDVDFMGIYVEYISGPPLRAFLESPYTDTLLRM